MNDYNNINYIFTSMAIHYFSIIFFTLAQSTPSRMRFTNITKSFTLTSHTMIRTSYIHYKLKFIQKHNNNKVSLFYILLLPEQV